MSANLQDNSTQNRVGIPSDPNGANAFANSIRNGGLGTAPVRVVHASPRATDGVSAPILALPLKNGAQHHFIERSLIFCYNRTSKGNAVTAVDLPSLNEGMEKAAAAAAREMLERGIAAPDGPRYTQESSKRLRDWNPATSIWPLTLEEFMENWAFAGTITAGMNRGLVDTAQHYGIGQKKGGPWKNFTIQLSGVAENMPNIWGPLQVLDRVGFIIKEIPMSANREFQNGLMADRASPLATFLQVIPWSSNGQTVKFPSYNSNPNPLGTPNFLTDRDYLRMQYQPQIEFETDPLTGLVNPARRTARSDTQSINFQSYTQGYYIQLGTVTHTQSPADKDQRVKALVSQEDYQKLGKTSVINVLLSPLGQFEERCG